jgi:hypothetical protein
MRVTAIVAILLSSLTLLGCGTMGQRVIDAYSVPPPQDPTWNGNAVNRDTALLPDGGGS